MNIDSRMFHDMRHQLSDFDDELENINFYERGKILNINLLWTPKVFEWFVNQNLDEKVENIIEWRDEGDNSESPSNI